MELAKSPFVSLIRLTLSTPHSTYIPDKRLYWSSDAPSRYPYSLRRPSLMNGCSSVSLISSLSMFMTRMSTFELLVALPFLPSTPPSRQKLEGVGQTVFDETRAPAECCRFLARRFRRSRTPKVSS